MNAGLASNAIARLTAASRKIVGHFKHSTVAMGALIERQSLLKLPEHSLVQDIATRWNSIIGQAAGRAESGHLCSNSQ